MAFKDTKETFSSVSDEKFSFRSLHNLRKILLRIWRTVEGDIPRCLIQGCEVDDNEHMSCPTPTIYLPEELVRILRDNATRSRFKREISDPSQKYRSES